ncbi:sulfur carrier protein ThiS [Alloyangia pacifica]|uniref:Sulfur carrier protein n=1 Tax=Alloyangia pacifica TaxID=311180 RepID=A0A1I6VVK7_9RHOB|nr:sulfur carrier protein ThiS [Alloyangia pacifica]SDI23930.1 sulfur carrier protein [Alloyangia pacifica]SFT17738.1 sulfur carrier protein [Alloyangia pacifica]
MKIVINGEPREVTATTLAGLLEERGLPGRVATAVNEGFVPATLRASHVLRDGDRVEILAPMQGG